MDRLTVGFLVPSTGASFTSLGLVAVGLARGLRAAGIGSQLIAAGRSGPMWLPSPHPFDSWVRVGCRGSFHGSPLFPHLGDLRQAIADVDVLHLIGYREPTVVAAGLLATTPIIVEPSGTLPRRERSFLLKRGFDATLGRILLARADTIVATGQIEADDFHALGVPLEKVTIRGLGVDVPDRGAVPSGRARARFQVPAGAELVVSIGRITTKKALHRLIPVIAERPNCYLVIAGPDERDGAREVLRQAISRYGVAARVRVAEGGVWEIGKWELLRDADVFCLPSNHENFAIAPAEAAAFGTPTIVTDVCGVAETLRACQGHVAVAPREGEVRAALHRVLDDRGVAADYAAANMAPLRRELSWLRVGRQQAAICKAAARSSRL